MLPSEGMVTIVTNRSNRQVCPSLVHEARPREQLNRKYMLRITHHLQVIDRLVF